MLYHVHKTKGFARWVLDAQAAETPLGIDGDDGRRIQRLGIYWLLSYLVHDNFIKCSHGTIEFQQEEAYSFCRFAWGSPGLNLGVFD